MARLTNRKTGVVVNVRDDKVDRLSPADWQLEGGSESTSSSKSSSGGVYGGLKVDELRAEIEKRNADRDEADLIASDGKKADLIAALEADDAAAGE